MHRHIVAVIALASIALDAHAIEVYRCTASGVTHYQDKPCAGAVVEIKPEKTGVSGLRDSEISAYLDFVERDVYRITGPSQSRQLDTVSGHLTILRRIVD
ncbi:MAG: DUF4124 domain-containing protein [Candidatus Competibacteraceae bacterium]|nr:DUF4124 domain-containing protein [Candidatus Competibacteraceae bacterium]